jgi:hypothetical protein
MTDMFTPERRSEIMANIHSADTIPEVQLRRVLHARSYPLPRTYDAERVEPPRLAPPRLPRLPPGLGPEYRIDGSCCLGTNLVFNGEVLDKPQWAGRKDARVANQLRSAGAGMKSSPRALGHARKTGHVLATFVVEATALYRLGGFLGILLGVST